MNEAPLVIAARNSKRRRPKCRDYDILPKINKDPDEMNNSSYSRVGEFGMGKKSIPSGIVH